jgi:uncharacterized phage protein gp47/JayE
MSYGITDQGFILKTEDDIFQEMIDDALLPENFGSTQDVSIYDPIGQIIAVAAKALADVWENMEDVFYSAFVDTATGINLDRVLALGGFTRNAAQPATVTITFTGTIGYAISAGTMRVKTAQDVEFENVYAGTIGAGGTVDIICRAITAGADGLVPANTVNIISTPVADVTAANNALASRDGKDQETDAAFRYRYKQRGTAGGSSVPAIIAALSNVYGVTRVNVFENPTHLLDSAGRMPNSIECLVAGTASDEDVANAIYGVKAAGIETIGLDVEVDVEDENGDTHPIKWTVPEEALINVLVSIKSNDDWTDDNETLIKSKTVQVIGGADTIGSTVTDYDGLLVGRNIEAWQIIANFDGIEGMDEVDVYVAFSPVVPTTGKFLEMPYNKYGRCDTSNVTIQYV